MFAVLLTFTTKPPAVLLAIVICVLRVTHFFLFCIFAVGVVFVSVLLILLLFFPLLPTHISYTPTYRYTPDHIFAACQIKNMIILYIDQCSFQVFGMGMVLHMPVMQWSLDSRVR